MKIIYRLSILLIFIFLSKNSYSQDSTSIPFPKNSLKFNFLPLFAHTFSFSYEREFAKRLSFELEGGYIFPLNLSKYAYSKYGVFNRYSAPKPLLASEGYLGRISLRYYLLKKENQNIIVYSGASLLYKYRHYENKYFYDFDHRESSDAESYLQSEKNIAYAGEIQGGIRYYPHHTNRPKHLLLEASIGIGFGTEHRTTQIETAYKGNRTVTQYINTHNEFNKPYFSFNPCFKLGYAF